MNPRIIYPTDDGVAITGPAQNNNALSYEDTE